MTARTGWGDLEIAGLTAVEELQRLVPQEVELGSVAPTSAVLELLEQRHGFGPRYAYGFLQDLAVPWRLHLPLLRGVGNWGSQQGDPAADARYTMVGLSPVGKLALAAERGEVGPVPFALIDGSLFREGPVPPFAPAAVLAALATGADDAGPPVLPTGGTVAGEVGALLEGRSARLALGCRVVVEDGCLVVTGVPLGVAIDLVTEGLASAARALGHTAGGQQRSRPPGWRPAQLAGVPITDIRDESTEKVGVRIVCPVATGTEPEDARRWLLGAWPATVEIDCRLPAPMRERLREWDPGDGSGIATLQALLNDDSPSEPSRPGHPDD